MLGKSKLIGRVRTSTGRYTLTPNTRKRRAMCLTDRLPEKDMTARLSCASSPGEEVLTEKAVY
jgi:hypothetical protein